MSRSTTPPRITGHAVIMLRNGTVYVGEAVYDGRAISGELSLRVTDLVGDTCIYSYRPAKRRTVPLHVVRSIVWDDDRRQC